MKKILVIIVLFIVVAVAIPFLPTMEEDKNLYQALTNQHDLPEFSVFVDSPTDQFIVNTEDYSRIARATPFYGSDTACAHSGGHIHYSGDGYPYEAELIAPVDGYISRVVSCFDLGTHDKFDIGLSFAKLEGKEVSFSYSVEPFDGLQCQDDPDFYDQFIYVEEGQEVKKGDVIAVMPKTNEDDNAHIHFNLNWDGSEQLLCPNIFTDDVVSAFGEMYNGQTCAGEPIPATFCYQPGEGEDIVGL